MSHEFQPISCRLIGEEQGKILYIGESYSTGDSIITRTKISIPLDEKGRTNPRKMVLNPPPSDLNCELCGKKVEELEPFSPKAFEANKQTEKIFEHFYSNPEKPFTFITENRKLSKRFRSFEEGYIDASWECSECFYLSNDEAKQRFKKAHKSHGSHS